VNIVALGINSAAPKTIFATAVSIG